MVVAKKSLGQNFLKDKNILNKVVDAAHLTEGDVVLEIGPGTGTLTRTILERGVQVVAIEKDPRMVQILHAGFADEIAAGRLQIHEGDILLDGPETFGLQDKQFKVIANIPYYITGAIIARLLESAVQPETMVLVMQREVADRIVSQENKKKHKESILSLSVKVYGVPEFITHVSNTCFSPAPRVDSAVIAIRNISKELFEQAGVKEQRFFSFMKQGFSQKRKTLLNNFKKSDFDSERLKQSLHDLEIDDRIRAEDLRVDDWFQLARENFGK